MWPSQSQRHALMADAHDGDARCMCADRCTHAPAKASWHTMAADAHHACCTCGSAKVSWQSLPSQCHLLHCCCSCSQCSLHLCPMPQHALAAMDCSVHDSWCSCALTNPCGTLWPLMLINNAHVTTKTIWHTFASDAHDAHCTLFLNKAKLPRCTA